MRWVKLVMLVFVALVLGLLAVANMAQVTLHIDPFRLNIPILSPLEMPLALVIFGALMLGLIVGLFLEWFRARPARRLMAAKRHEIRDLQKQIDELQHELKIARNSGNGTAVNLR